MSKVYKPRVIPHNWSLIKIKDIANTGSGGTPLSTVKEYYENGTIPWINSGEIGQNRIKKAEKYITIKGKENSSATLFPKASVLVALYGATAGKASLLDIEATTNQAVCAIYPSKTFNSQFLKYYIDTLYWYLVGVSTGSARDNLSQKGIQELEIPFPDIHTQKSIAKVLSDLDTKIELNNRLNHELEAMAKTLYDYWFVQFDFPNEQGKPYKSSGGRMVYNEELKKEIPEAWKVKTLANITSVSNDSINPMLSPDKEFKHYSIPIFDSTKSYGTEKGDDIRSNKFTVTEADVLVSKLNPWFRRVIYPINEPDLICSTEFVVWRTTNSNIKNYLYMLARGEHFISHCTQSATGTSNSHKRVNPKVMMRYKVAFNSDLVQKYGKTIDPWIQMSINKQQENKQLTKLRDWLLPMLMNGQVTVGEAEEKLNIAAEPNTEYENR